MTELELKQLLSKITRPDETARTAAHAHWASLAKPLGGLGRLETMLEDANGERWPMAGVLPGQGFRVGRLVRFGYAALTAHADSMLFRAGERLPVHEFHHWDSTDNGTGFTAAKPNGKQWDCGFANEHFYAGFPHLYWAGTALPRRFVDAAAHYHQEEQDH